MTPLHSPLQNRLLSALPKHELAQLAEHLIEKLGLVDQDAHIFRLSVEAEHSRSEKQRRKAKLELITLTEAAAEMPPKTFTVVDWVTEAVLKLSERGSGIEDAEKIAARLDTPVFMVVAALRFLARLGLVKGNKRYRTYLKSRGQGRQLNVDYSQVLEQAQKSYIRNRTQRDLFHHQALLIETQDLVAAKKIILKCFKELQSLEKKTKNAKLYFTALQLFSVEPEGKKDDKKN